MLSKVAANALIFETIFVSHGIKATSITANISFSASQLSSVKVQSILATTGTFSVSVVGTMFSSYGVSPRVLSGASSCEISFWVSDSCATCKVSRGVAIDLTLTLSLNKYSIGTLSNSLSYSECFISSVKSAPIPSSGTTLVTIAGYSIGVFGALSKSRVFGSAGASSSWISDSTVVSKSSRNVADAYFVQVTSGRQVSSVFSRSITHDTPLISAVSVTNVPVSCSASITVSGFNFGGYLHSLSAAKAESRFVCFDCSFVGGRFMLCSENCFFCCLKIHFECFCFGELTVVF